MKNLSYLLLVSTFLFSCSEKILSTAVLNELEAAERAMFHATSAGDAEAFKKICGEDYYTINANGEGLNLEEALPHVPRFKGVVDELSEQSQRVFGNFVIRNGHLKAFMNGKLLGEIIYSSGWIYRDGRWQFVHWQGTLTGAALNDVSMREPPKVEGN